MAHLGTDGAWVSNGPALTLASAGLIHALRHFRCERAGFAYCGRLATALFLTHHPVALLAERYARADPFPLQFAAAAAAEYANRVLTA